MAKRRSPSGRGSGGGRRKRREKPVLRDDKGRFRSPEKESKKRPKKSPRRGKRGRFVSKEDLERQKRSDAAKKGWEKRKKRRTKASKASKAPTYRDAKGRFISRRKWIVLQAASKAKAKRDAAKERERKRKLAAKKGWETRRAKQRERERQRAEDRKRQLGRYNRIAPVIDFFETDPMWSYSWWSLYEGDGTAEGQGHVYATNDSFHEWILTMGARTIEAARKVSAEIPLWWSVGVTFSELDDDSYDSYGGESLIMTYSRRVGALPLVFMGARQIGENLIEVGGKISGIVVACFYGKRSPSE